MDTSDAGKSCSSGSSDKSHGSLQEGEKVVLEKQVGLLGSISLVAGIIIGSGIFISPAGVAEGAGSVGLSLLLWGVGGIVTLLASLVMAELGTTMPQSGGDYVYVKRTLPDWVAFLWMWTNCFLLKPASNAVIGMTCAEYILVPIFEDDCGAPPEMYNRMLFVAILMTVTAINCYSVRLASSIQIIFTMAKILALIIIIIGGIVNMINGKLDNLKTGFEGTNTNPGEIMLGLYNAMFAYDGWNQLNCITEEVINPGRTMPLAMYLGMPIITVLYMLTNVSYFTVMSVDELISSDAVAITWANSVIPKVAWIIPLSVAMSTFGGMNGGTFASGRVYYAAAKQGHQPKILSYIHCKNFTPSPAILFIMVLGIIYSFLGEVRALLDFLNYAAWIFYGLIMFVAMYMRVKEPFKSMHRPYRTPFVLPLIVFIFSVAMVIIPLATAPQIEFLYATLIMLAGFIFYFPLVYFKKQPQCMKSVTSFFQLLMEVVPPDDVNVYEKQSIKTE